MTWWTCEVCERRVDDAYHTCPSCWVGMQPRLGQWVREADAVVMSAGLGWRRGEAEYLLVFGDGQFVMRAR